jgi:hypothetical protein
MPAAELLTYARELRWILDQVAACLEGLSAPQLNWRPDTHVANSAYAIAAHVAGSTRVYALGFGCGQPVARDRGAELAARGDAAGPPMAALRQLAAEIDGALAALPASRLDERLVPPRELWGTGEPRDVSRRDALVESIRHAALHLGELRLTRDMALALAPGLAE